MEAALEVKDLIKHYPVRGSILGSIAAAQRRVVHAVDGISFAVTPGEILGLVGESGCGKTTTGKLVTRLEAPTSGSIVFQGRDIAGLSQSQLRAVRQDLQIIFQDPYDSLDPRYTVEMAVQEPLRAQGVDAAERRRRVEETLEMVELRPARMFMSRYPHELSGGQRQRVAIARAMIVRPRFVIADEPVSMLDVSIRAGLLTLMRNWNQELGVSFLFITHDLGVARYMSHRIVVMYLGKIVETGLTEAVIGQPKHPYTQMLIAAVPDPDPRNRRVEQELRGDVASAIDPPSGCRFHPRCPIAQAICAEQEPLLRPLRDGRLAACHFAE